MAIKSSFCTLRSRVSVEEGAVIAAFAEFQVCAIEIAAAESYSDDLCNFPIWSNRAESAQHGRPACAFRLAPHFQAAR
jgi:hypothetical protein